MSLAERAYRHSNFRESPGMRRIIKPPEYLYGKTEFTPLQYVDGVRPRGIGEKWFLGKLGPDKIKEDSSNLVEITENNFDQCLTVTKERVAKFQKKPWQNDETFKIIFLEKEQKIRDGIRDYLFGIHLEQEKLSKEEKEQQRDPIIIRVREIDPQYQKASQGRYLKVEFINLIVGHSGDPSTPPPLELYTVNIVLPVGVNKQTVFSEYSMGQSISFEDEEMWMITILDKENYHPMFPIARDLFHKLSARSLVDERINKKQVEETIICIDEKISTDIHPNSAHFDGQDSDGHYYNIDKQGKRILVIRYFDNKEAKDDFVENAEKKTMNKPTGFVHVFRPKGGGLSAGTSKNNPAQKNFENWMVVCPDGSIHEEMSKEALIRYWQNNYPNLPLIMPNENIPPPIIPELRIDPRTRLAIDPFFLRNILPRTEFDPFIPRYPNQPRTLSAFSIPPEPERNLTFAAVPLFFFPLGEAVRQKAMEEIVVSAFVEDMTVELATGTMLPDANHGNLDTESIFQTPTIAPELTIIPTPQNPSVSQTHIEIFTYTPLPQTPHSPGGGGEVLPAEQQDLNKESKTNQEAASRSEKRENETALSQNQSRNVSEKGKITETANRRGLKEKDKGLSTQNTNTTVTDNKAEAEIKDQTSGVGKATPKSIRDHTGNSGETLIRATTQVEIKNTSQTADKENIFRHNQTINVKAPTIIFPKIQELNIIQFQTPSGQIIQIPQVFLEPQEWLSLWQQQTLLEDGLKEVWQKVGDFMGPYQQTVYTVGLIFVILLKLLNGGIVLI